MKIHFCDLCNESVPQSDLDAGRARLVKGRVVCASCERAMSLANASAGARPAQAAELAAPASGAGQPAFPAPAAAAAPAAAPAARPASAGLWVAVIGLLATAGVVVVFQRRIDELAQVGSDLAQRASQQERGIAKLEGSLRGAVADQIATEKRWQLEFERLADRFEVQAKSLAKSAEGADRAREELQQALGHLRDDLRQGTLSGEQRLDELSHRIAQSEDAQRDLREKLGDFQKSAEEARKAAELAAKAAPVQPAQNAPAWSSALANLGSDNPSLRWEAVDELGRSKDTAVIPHVTPMLRDADLFVRMCAARVLGDLGTLQGVAALIDSLEDSEPTVRESAWNALRSLTGKDIRFDPQGSETERQKRVKQWREWWKKEGEALLNGGAGGEGGANGGEPKTPPPDVKSGTQRS